MGVFLRNEKTLKSFPKKNSTVLLRAPEQFYRSLQTGSDDFLLSFQSQTLEEELEKRKVGDGEKKKAEKTSLAF